MVYAPVRSIISSLKLGDYLSVQAHKPCSISHLEKVLKSCHRLSDKHTKLLLKACIPVSQVLF